MRHNLSSDINMTSSYRLIHFPFVQWVIQQEVAHTYSYIYRKQNNPSPHTVCYQLLNKSIVRAPISLLCIVLKQPRKIRLLHRTRCTPKVQIIMKAMNDLTHKGPRLFWLYKKCLSLSEVDIQIVLWVPVTKADAPHCTIAQSGWETVWKLLNVTG